MAARLKERYNTELRAQLQDELGLSNPMAVPRLLKIVVNVGVGRATQDIKELDRAVDELAVVTGQKPSIRRAQVGGVVPVARGHADRRHGDVARRADVRVSRPADRDRAAARA